MAGGVRDESGSVEADETAAATDSPEGHDQEHEQQQGLRAQVADLRDEIESLRQSQQAYKDHVIKPRIEDLQTSRDDARAERAELHNEIDTLREQVHHLQTKVETLIGLAHDQESNPEKRAADLAQALIRRAEDRDDENEGRAATYWKEVQNLFSDLGHGDVAPPDCYKAMDAVAQRPGFTETTKASRDGNEVKAVAVNVAELDPETPVSDPKTSAGPSDPQHPLQNGGEFNHG